MSRFDNQVLNRAVSIRNLSQTNMNQFEHVHLTISQLKSLYLNSKKIHEISSDLIELERYLVHYQSEISQAQDSESDDEKINQASYAANVNHPASDRDTPNKPEHFRSSAKHLERSNYHHRPTRIKEHHESIKHQSKSWCQKLIKIIKNFLNKYFDFSDGTISKNN